MKEDNIDYLELYRKFRTIAMDYNIQVITASQIKVEPNNRYAEYLLSKHRVGGTGTMYYDYNMVISRLEMVADDEK